MKNNLLQYHNKLLQLIKPFESAFTKPQYNNFKQSVSCMAVSSHATIDCWAELFDKKHQTSLDRFFIESPWDIKKVKTKFNLVSSKFISPFSIGIIDDTLSHKPFATKMEMVGKHYDHLNGRHEKGHSIVTSGYHTNNQFLPHDLEVYQRKCDLSNKAAFKTKNQIAGGMIDNMSNQKKLFCFVFDTWYSNKHIIKRIKANNKHYVTQIKSNRNVTLSRREKAVREHAKYIKEKQFKELIINGSKFKLFGCSAFIRGIGSVLLLFCRMWLEDKKKWSDMNYIITDLISFSEESILRLYLMRGGIESFHREAKQHLGLESYQIRKSRGIERYLFLVMITYALLVMLIMLPYGKMRALTTIGDVCRALKEDCYTNLLKNSKNANDEDIRNASRQLAVAY